MVNKHFYFGEKIKEFKVRVFNEREVRAAAGLLFLGAIISFLNAWLIGNFAYIKLFVVFFLLDFSIRLFINPNYSPSMILGRFFVQNQEVEYVGAPQKRYAWFLGWFLSLAMLFIVVINDIRGPLNLGICLLCLTFLFFESVFGICIGCKLYNLFNKQKAEQCPGGVCKIKRKEKIQKISLKQVVVLIIFLLLMFFIATKFLSFGEEAKIRGSNGENINSEEETSQDCVPPQWAIDIGHEEMWKLHHGCT